MELADLAASGERLQVGEIAARQAIPERYLEQMMTSLRRAGILRSIRGARGGYQLAKAAEQIRLSEVIRCLEGEHHSSDPSSGSTELQVINALAEDLRRQRFIQLEATTLAEIDDAVDRVIAGMEGKPLTDGRSKRLIAYHEVGHALV
ncbi:MAG: Rrf2 family transcriptional regulator, partial [Vulcanococcus sp.]